MSCRDGGFHFIDLLSLHLKVRLNVAGCRGMLALLHRLTDAHLPALAMYPRTMVEAACEHLYAQYPWLRPIEVPGWVRANDWAAFWGWVDHIQCKVGTDADGHGTDYSVTEMPAHTRTPDGGQVVVIEADPAMLRALLERLMSSGQFRSLDEVMRAFGVNPADLEDED